MRESLTILAGLLVLVLAAAFAGPYFVDWSAQRDRIEAELSRATGAQVSVQGTIDVKLLPTPRLVLEEVTLRGQSPGDPALTARALRFELAVAPLLRGEFRFTEAEADEPLLRLTMGADGGVALPSMPVSQDDRIAIDRLTVHNGALIVLDAQSQRRLDARGVNIDAEVASLAGPFKGSASFGPADSPVTLRFTTGQRELERIRVKAIVDEFADLPRMDFDGALILSDGAAGALRLRYEGPTIFSGAVGGSPWRAAGLLKADVAGAVIEPLDLRAGADDKGLTANGSARIDFDAAHKVRLDLKARQIDIDRLLDGQTQDRLGPLVAQWIEGARAPAQPLSVAVESPAVTLGGDTLAGARVTVEWSGGRDTKLSFEADTPGRAHIAANGALETGVAAKFSGAINASSRDLTRFTEWLAGVAPDLAARAKSLPLRTLDVAGDMEISRVGFSGRNLTIKADRSTLTGAVAFTQSVGGAPARLFADLNSPALDLDSAPDLSATAATDMDMALTLDARAVRLARFGEGVVDAGNISVKLTKTGDSLTLDRFTIANLGGANVTATGASGPSGVKLDARLDATRLIDLAALVKRVAPGVFADALAARAVALSPARFNLKIDAPPGSPAESARRGTVTFDAVARGTTVRGSARPDGANGVAASANVETQDVALLLRQLGFATVGLTNYGSGRATIVARGDPEQALTTKIDATLAGSNLNFDGLVRAPLSGLSAVGSVTAITPNANPLLQITGLMTPDPTAAASSANLSGRFVIGGGQWSFVDIGGRFAGATVRGSLDGAISPMRGALRIDTLSLGDLSSLAFGAPRQARAGALWSETRFGAAVATLPDADIELAIGRFDLGAGVLATDAKMTLGLRPGAISLSNFALSLSSGSASGDLTLRRDGATAALSGKVRLANIVLDRPTLSGRIDGSFDVTATGVSAMALASGLAGGGSVTATGLKIPRADPDAVDRVMALAEQERIPAAEPDVRSALGLEFDKAPLDLGSRTFDARLAVGTLSLSTKGAQQPALAFGFDMRTLAIDERVSIPARNPPRDWNDAPPQATIQWKGAFATPARTIDASALGNALSARAIARETARVQAFEADIRERAFFNRRLKGLQFMQQRDREIAAYEADQARLAAEAEKRRIEDEKRRADEEKKRADEQARLAAEIERRRAEEQAKQEREQRLRDTAEQARQERERIREIIEQRRTSTPANSTQPIAPPPALAAPGGAVDPSAAGRY